MKKVMYGPRAHVVHEDAHGRPLTPNEFFIELSAWTGARPDLIAVNLTEDEALSLVQDLVKSMIIQRERSRR